MALLAAAVGCGGPSWPAAGAVGDPGFLSTQNQVRTIDILPIDMQVWAQPGSQRDATELTGVIDVTMASHLEAELARRGYLVWAQMGWDGSYVAPDGQPATAMDPESVGLSAYALSSFGQAQSQAGDRLLIPYLPVPLGQATGSDATLYVGGWAFAGKKKSSGTGSKVAKGLLIGAVAVVAVVAVLAALDGKGGGLGKAAGGVAKGAGKAVSGAARVAGYVIRPVGRIAGRTAAAMVRGNVGIHIDLDMVGALADTPTHYDYAPQRPNYYQQRTPKKGRSAMQVEMTLIDNRTGRVLWHTRNRFPARPTAPGDVSRVVASSLRTLPPAR